MHTENKIKLLGNWTSKQIFTSTPGIGDSSQPNTNNVGIVTHRPLETTADFCFVLFLIQDERTFNLFTTATMVGATHFYGCAKITIATLKNYVVL